MSVRSVFKKIRRMLPFSVRAAYFRSRRTKQNKREKHSFCTEKCPDESLYNGFVFSHRAHLIRNYPEPWFSLQKNKIVNLDIAAHEIDRVILEPGKTFSFWELVGPTIKRRGFLPGMTISDGKLAVSIGGGLCQLSNALYWTALHLGDEIIERHRHSLDIFPDSHRNVPFAAGATVYYNYLDFRFRHVQEYPILLRVFVDQAFLNIHAWAPHKLEYRYIVEEKNHRFVQKTDGIWRENELHVVKTRNNTVVSSNLVAINRGKVVYDISHINAEIYSEAGNG